MLPGLSPLSEEQKKGLRAIVTDFNADSVAELAEIEAVTVHDVKAVEYYIGRRLRPGPGAPGAAGSLRLHF